MKQHRSRADAPPTGPPPHPTGYATVSKPPRRVRVSLEELRSLLSGALLARGCDANSAEYVADHYLLAELSKKPTHGLAKFLKELPHVTDREGSPKIARDAGAMVLVDGRRELGPVAARFACDLVSDRAARHGVALVAMKNIQRYGTLGPFARRIAGKRLVGIVANGCEPAMIADGASRPVLGSNPLAMAFPTGDAPIVLDMATSSTPLSAILVSSISGSPLPAGCFLDKDGEFTRSPQDVAGVTPFDGHKGFGLALAIGILAGPLTTGAMGWSVSSHYDLGYLFLAIDPGVFQPTGDFERESRDLIRQLKASARGGHSVRIPGERSRELADGEEQSLDIYESIYEELREQGTR